MDDSRSPDSASEGDVRVRRSKDAVLAATFELMTQMGLSRVSLDEVARRSGVAKTTIYRHWPSRSALLLDACSRLGGEAASPDTGSLEGDLTALATNLASQLQTAKWPTVLPSIVDAAERDPELAELHARHQAAFSEAYVAAVERAAQRGEIAAPARPTETAAAILGPIFYRRWFSREPIDEAFIRAVVIRTVAALMAAR